MKNCSVCGNVLETPLGECGDPREPVCIHCYLSGATELPPSDDDEKLVEIDKELADVIGDIDMVKMDINELEGRLSELKWKRSKLRVEKRRIVAEKEKALDLLKKQLANGAR